MWKCFTMQGKFVSKLVYCATNLFLPLIIAELDRRFIELKINKTLQKVL